jgi:hypothetical protein
MEKGGENIVNTADMNRNELETFAMKKSLEAESENGAGPPEGRGRHARRMLVTRAPALR